MLSAASRLSSTTRMRWVDRNRPAESSDVAGHPEFEAPPLGGSIMEKGCLAPIHLFDDPAFYSSLRKTRGDPFPQPAPFKRVFRSDYRIRLVAAASSLVGARPKMLYAKAVRAGHESSVQQCRAGLLPTRMGSSHERDFANDSQNSKTQSPANWGEVTNCGDGVTRRAIIDYTSPMIARYSGICRWIVI